MDITVEVWISAFAAHEDWRKAADGLFVFVAIDDDGKPRALPVIEAD